MTSHKFVVYTERDELDSLKQAINIAFTLTPVEPRQGAHAHIPKAMTIQRFASGVSRVATVEWSSRVAFSKYEIKGPLFAIGDHISPQVPPGHCVTMTGSPPDQSTQWSGPLPYDDDAASGQGSFKVVNRTGSRQRICLRIQDPYDSLYWTSMIYDPLKQGGCITVPEEMMLQVFVVRDAITGKTVLEANNLVCPLFETPVSCKELPATSRWKLSQDIGGAFRLTNDEWPELGRSPVKLLAESINDVKSQLAAVLKTLSYTQDRVAIVEKAVRNTQDEVMSGQQAILDIRNQLSGADRNMRTVEAKADSLTESFSQSRSSLSAVEKTLGGTRSALSAVETSVQANQNGILELHRKFPLIGSKMSTLATSFTQCQDRLNEIEKSVNRPHMGQTAVQLAAETRSQISTGEAHLTHTERGAAGGFRLQGSPLVIQDQVAALDRRVPVVEAKADKLARAFSQTAERLSSVNQSHQVTRQLVAGLDRRIPMVEGKVRNLEQSFGLCQSEIAGMQVLLGNTEEALSGLEGRVLAAEAKVDKLGGRSLSSPINESPYTFPSRLDHGPPTPHRPPPAGATAEEPDPWSSSLFQTLGS